MTTAERTAAERNDDRQHVRPGELLTWNEAQQRWDRRWPAQTLGPTGRGAHRTTYTLWLSGPLSKTTFDPWGGFVAADAQ